MAWVTISTIDLQEKQSRTAALCTSPDAVASPTAVGFKFFCIQGQNQRPPEKIEKTKKMARTIRRSSHHRGMPTGLLAACVVHFTRVDAGSTSYSLKKLSRILSRDVPSSSTASGTNLCPGSRSWIAVQVASKPETGGDHERPLSLSLSRRLSCLGRAGRF